MATKPTGAAGPSIGAAMRYDVIALPKDAKCVEKWPELEEVFGLRFDPSIRYVLLMTDLASPCLKIGDIRLRKERAHKLAGMDPDTLADTLDPSTLYAKGLAYTTLDWLKSQGTGALDLATFLSEYEKYFQDLTRINMPIKVTNAKTGEDQDDAEMRAYVGREDLAAKLPAALSRIKSLSDKLFKGDTAVEAYALKEERAGRVEQQARTETFAG